MISNYLKTFWRNLTRNRLFSLINLIGLSVSMALGLFIIMLVMDEFSYDRFHPKKERIYRINSDLVYKNTIDHFASSPALLAAELNNTYSDAVEDFVRIRDGINSDAMANNGSSAETNAARAANRAPELPVHGWFADPSFFALFQFDLKEGNKQFALVEPYTAVISEATASRFFGKADPLEKSIFLKQFGRYVQIKGVIKPVQGKTHFLPELLVSWSTLYSLQTSGQMDSLQNWNNYSATNTFVLLKPGYSRSSLNLALSLLAQKINPNIPSREGWHYQFYSQALTEISPSRLILIYELTRGATMTGIYLYIGIGIIVLCLACFNYTNLSMAKSLSRAKEIGIRKVNGAGRRQVFAQFIIEAMLFSMVSLGIATILLQGFSGIEKIRELLSEYRLSPTVWLMAIAFGIITGLLAGVLPAWVLSSFQPAQILKSLNGVKVFKGLALRKVLIGIQFAASIILVVVLLVMIRQTRYMANSDYGFSRQDIVNIRLKGIDYKTFSNELRQDHSVAAVSAGSGLLGFTDMDETDFSASPGAEQLHLDYFSVDREFLSTMELRLLAGSNFPADVSDSSERYILLNEQAIQILQLGDPNAAIGKTVYVDQDKKPLQVIGVLKDFHYLTKKLGIQPMALRYQPAGFLWASVKLNHHTADKSFTALNAIWKKLRPGESFEASLLEDEFEQRHGHKSDLLLFFSLAAITLSLACLGIIGISVYSATEKRKEVAIRKTLGAGVFQIAYLLSRNLLILVIISALIALPIGYLLGHQFLQQYVNRQAFGIWILPAAFGTIACFALLSSGWQVLRAALANPANSLRDA